MLKDNGMLHSAKKEELANISNGKYMFCPTCNKEVLVVSVKFGETTCETCGTLLVDLNTNKAHKLTGSK